MAIYGYDHYGFLIPDSNPKVRGTHSVSLNFSQMTDRRNHSGAM